MDVNWIVSTVKQVILETGEFPMTVFIENDSTDIEHVRIPQEGDPDTRGRARVLFIAGRRYGKKARNKKRGITGLALASEGWSAPANEERPKFHPKRKEIVQIAELGDDPGFAHSMRIYELLRDGSGRLVDLLAMKEQQGSLSPLLPAFMLGAITAKRGDSESDASHMLQKILMEYERLIRKAGMI